MAVDGISVYLGKKLLDLAFGDTAFVPPATVFACALTTMPSDRSGTGAVEVTNASNYSRFSITNNTTNFTASSGSTTETKGIGANWTFATPSGSWGTVVGVALADSGTYGAGNWLGFYTFATSQAISAANPLIVAIANLVLA